MSTQTHIYVNVHSIQNDKKCEQSQCPSTGEWTKETEATPTAAYSIANKELSAGIRYSTDESQKSANRKKSDQ